MAFNNEIEEVKAQLKVLEKKLALLEELEKTKTPCEEAFKEFYGAYPITDIADTSWDSDGWVYFEAGYNAAQKDYKVGEYQEPEVREWDVVRESVKWCEEHPDKDPLDWVKPQTPEQVADGLKEAFREAVKQGVVSSTTKPQTLSDLIYDWWERVFGDTDDTETSIENLVDEISLWLPTEHDTNSYKWNECIRMIREKLR
jgi:hypothetical protein